MSAPVSPSSASSTQKQKPRPFSAAEDRRILREFQFDRKSCRQIAEGLDRSRVAVNKRLKKLLKIAKSKGHEIVLKPLPSSSVQHHAVAASSSSVSSSSVHRHFHAPAVAASSSSSSSSSLHHTHNHAKHTNHAHIAQSSLGALASGHIRNTGAGTVPRNLGIRVPQAKGSKSRWSAADDEYLRNGGSVEDMAAKYNCPAEHVLRRKVQVLNRMREEHIHALRSAPPLPAGVRLRGEF